MNSAHSLPIGSLSLETSATALCGRYVKAWQSNTYRISMYKFLISYPKLYTIPARQWTLTNAALLLPLPVRPKCWPPDVRPQRPLMRWTNMAKHKRWKALIKKQFDLVSSKPNPGYSNFFSKLHCFRMWQSWRPLTSQHVITKFCNSLVLKLCQFSRAILTWQLEYHRWCRWYHGLRMHGKWRSPGTPILQNWRTTWRLAFSQFVLQEVVDLLCPEDSCWSTPAAGKKPFWGLIQRWKVFENSWNMASKLSIVWASQINLIGLKTEYILPQTAGLIHVR